MSLCCFKWGVAVWRLPKLSVTGQSNSPYDWFFHAKNFNLWIHIPLYFQVQCWYVLSTLHHFTTWTYSNRTDCLTRVSACKKRLNLPFSGGVLSACIKLFAIEIISSRVWGAFVPFIFMHLRPWFVVAKKNRYVGICFSFVFVNIALRRVFVTDASGRP